MTFFCETVITDLGDGIHLIDANYVRNGLAAIYLVVDCNEVAVIETGTRYSFPLVIDALSRLGLSAEAVRYVIPTHVHLDHAGGAGTMISRFPSAQLVVHPSGAPHMIDPARLWAGATAVYGEEAASALYGGLDPVPERRILPAAEGSVLPLRQRSLSVLDTPGHAYHHICVYDPVSNGVFTGDVFGLSYRELDVGSRPSAVISTTPTQFDPLAMRRSIDRIAEIGPSSVFMTHFSRVTAVGDIYRQLIDQLDAYLEFEAVSRRGASDQRAFALERLLRAYYEDWRMRAGWNIGQEALQSLLDIDLRLNAQGLAHWSVKQSRSVG